MTLSRILVACPAAVAIAACSGGDASGGGSGLHGEGPLRGDVLLRVTAQGTDVYYETSFARFATGTDPDVTAFEWSRWEEPGECTSDLASLEMDLIPIGDTVRLIAPGFTATAVQVSAGTSNVSYSWNGGGDAGTPLGTSFDVELSGTDTLEPVYWENGLSLLDLPIVEAPAGYQSGNVVIDAQSDLLVEWEKMGADLVVVELSDGDQLRIFCGSEDSGSLTIPASVIQSLPVNGTMFVRAFRNRFREFRDGEALLQGRTSRFAAFTKT